MTGLPAPWLPVDRLAEERDWCARMCCITLADATFGLATPLRFARDYIAMRNALAPRRVAA